MTALSATERLRRVLRDFMASANIPAAASNVQQGILAKLGAADAINAIAPIWEGMRLIRDEVTNAAKGQIQVTAIALHNFAIPAGRWVRAHQGQDRLTARRPRCNPSAAGSGGAHGCRAVRPARADREGPNPMADTFRAAVELRDGGDDTPGRLSGVLMR